MAGRSFLVPFFFTLATILSGLSASSVAAPRLAPRVFNHSAALFKVGYDGCGFDNPCEREEIPRHSGRRHSQPYVNNNYGTVNVYVDRHRRISRTVDASVDCCAGEVWPEERGEEAEDRQNADGCGPLCWMHRFRQGYCGHGCGVYGEKVEFERAHRIVEYPRPVFYRRPSFYREPAPEPYNERPSAYERRVPQRPLERVQKPRTPDLTPRGRFEGPEYPAGCDNSSAC